MGVRYMICHWAINRTDPQNLLSMTLDVPLQPDWEVGVEKNNEDKTLVKPEQLEIRKTETVEIIVDGVDLLEEVRKSKIKDDEVVKAMEEMKRAEVKMLRDEE